MKKSFFCASVLAGAVLALLVAAQVDAQTMMPICAWSRTYSASMVRGYWFQAPTDICITGLEVPNEAGESVQNVQVWINPTPPPAYPGTWTTGSVFWMANQPAPAAGAPPGSAIIATGGIDVLEDEYVGLSGACGTSTLRNSYCTNGTKQTTLAGYTIDYSRGGSQFNINPAPAPSYWSEVAFGQSRVFMWYTVGACGGGPQTGACCVGTACTIEDEPSCTAMSGVYQGNGTSCTPNPCIGGGGGCSPAQCANLDCSICDVQDAVDALETKADQLQGDVTSIMNDVSSIGNDVTYLVGAVDALEVKLDEIEIGDIPCETLRLILPFLPGHPELPTTHQCFVGTTTLTPASGGGRLEMGGRSGQTVDPG